MKPVLPASLSAGLLLFTSAAHAQPPLVLDDNLAVLKAQKPATDYQFLGSNAPGQLFLPGETATLRFSLARGNDTGLVKDFFVEVQEITTRDPDARSKGGWTDTTGNAPLIGLEGAPPRYPLHVTFTDAPTATVEVANFPLPQRFGTYALVLVRGDKRQFLGTVARVPKPRADANVDNTPIFGEGVLIDHEGARADYYARMGVRGWRAEAGWNEKPDGTVDWSRFDKLFASAKANGCQVMLTLGGHPEWTRPFSAPTPAARWTPKTHGYGGTGDWLCAPALDERYGKWLETFLNRYWEGGRGGLWGLENYNEPWEGGGISGWASDARRYRDLQKLIATSARKVDPRIKILAASSIMNTEDKLYSDGTNAMDPFIDIFTDHYVPPVGLYGPMVARKHGKASMETETWFVNSEYSLAQGVVQFMACGQERISPWHPRVLFDTVPGNKNQYFIPTPVTVASAAFNNMVTGKKFEKMLFPGHLPFSFQYGKDTDADGLVILFGRLYPIGSDNFRVQLWHQINSVPGGTITIDNSDGLLQFYDLAGNPAYLKQKKVQLPLTFLPTYIKSRRGPGAVAARLNTAVIEGKQGVEIAPRDFTSLPTAAGSTLKVEVRNRLNAPLKGTLTVTPPAKIKLGTTSQAVSLAPGEARLLEFPVQSAQLSPANAYPCGFGFKGSGQDVNYSETINAAVVPFGTRKVDGDLADWEDVPGVSVIGLKATGDISEQLRRPWLELQQANPEATAAQVKLAWDENFLYIAARVNDPTPEKNAVRFAERDEDSFFHSAASDSISPYKEFIEEVRAKTKDASRSFAEVKHVYARNPEAGIPFRRDRLQFAFDTSPGWRDLSPVTQVPEGFHVVPDADYEYSVYWVDDQKNGSAEIWRHLAPGLPRIHDFPRQPRGERTTGVPPGASAVVRRETNGYIYEAAIPASELAELKLAAGTSVGFTFVAGNSSGLSAFYGADKAVTKNNSLTLHPYWENSPNAATRWTFTR